MVLIVNLWKGFLLDFKPWKDALLFRSWGWLSSRSLIDKFVGLLTHGNNKVLETLAIDSYVVFGWTSCVYEWCVDGGERESCLVLLTPIFWLVISSFGGLGYSVSLGLFQIQNYNWHYTKNSISNKKILVVDSLFFLWCIYKIIYTL